MDAWNAARCVALAMDDDGDDNDDDDSVAGGGGGAESPPATPRRWCSSAADLRAWSCRAFWTEELLIDW